jgi:hypothetical protein
MRMTLPRAILLVLAAAACGGTTAQGSPPDGGEAGSRTGSSTTGGPSSTGAGGSSTTGVGGNNGTTGGGGNNGTTGGGGDSGSGGSGLGGIGNGGANTGVGGAPETGGSAGASGSGTGGARDGGTGSPDGAGGAGGGMVCGGRSGMSCFRGYYCDYQPAALCGAFDQTGRCVPIPLDGCTADCPGVCGCNGGFFCNACLAHRSGTDDSADRSCMQDGAMPEICGGVRGVTCGPDSFCDYEPGAMCSGGIGAGICRPRPHVCPADCPGVCGCDGKFYCSVCVAQSMGIDDSTDVGCLGDR